MGNEFFGPGSIHQLEGILGKRAPSRVFIVAGKRSFEQSGAGRALEKWLQGIDYRIHHDFRENPDFDDLIRGAGRVREFQPDVIIAIGGGSAIDTAKIISVLPDDTQQAGKTVTGELAVTRKIAPLVVIPTTSGSGSEATHFAVAYKDDKKYSVAGNLLSPDYVIIDPELTYSLPPHQTAVSGMDALCQAVESYWAESGNDHSREMAADAIGTILPNLVNAVNRPGPESRLAMARGANLAGKAINVTKTTAPHALSYPLTTFYGIPHGHAVALTLGEFLVLNAQKAKDYPDGKLAARMNNLFRLLGANDAEESREKIRMIMDQTGLQTSLSGCIAAGHKAGHKADLHLILAHVNTERLQNHPVRLTGKDIATIINTIM